MSEIPEWAGREACRRLGENYAAFAIGRISSGVSKGIRLAAELIARHEQEPVDPLESEALAILATAIRNDDAELSHVQALKAARQKQVSFAAVQSALRRGIEIGKSQ